MILRQIIFGTSDVLETLELNLEHLYHKISSIVWKIFITKFCPKLADSAVSPHLYLTSAVNFEVKNLVRNLDWPVAIG